MFGAIIMFPITVPVDLFLRTVSRWLPSVKLLLLLVVSVVFVMASATAGENKMMYELNCSVVSSYENIVFLDDASSSPLVQTTEINYVMACAPVILN